MSTKETAKVIGWAGIESYDLILYFTAILSSTNKKVLIIDQSETEALTYCVPIPSVLNPKEKKIACKNFDFIKEKNVSEFLNEYDFILIDFGFRITHRDLFKCDEIFLITDKQQHNIDRICRLKTDAENIYLILKDLTRKDKIEVLLESLKESIPITDHYILEFDEIDKEKMIALQYNNEIQFKSMSGQYKYLLEQILINSLNINHYEFGKAYKKLKRGA